MTHLPPVLAALISLSLITTAPELWATDDAADRGLTLAAIQERTFDGSNEEALQTQLARWKEDLSPAAYDQLAHALGVLMVASIEPSSRVAFIASLDGKTVKDVVNEAHVRGQALGLVAAETDPFR